MEENSNTYKFNEMSTFYQDEWKRTAGKFIPDIIYRDIWNKIYMKFPLEKDNSLKGTYIFKVSPDRNKLNTAICAFLIRKNPYEPKMLLGLNKYHVEWHALMDIKCNHDLEILYDTFESLCECSSILLITERNTVKVDDAFVAHDIVNIRHQTNRPTAVFITSPSKDPTVIFDGDVMKEVHYIDLISADDKKIKAEPAEQKIKEEPKIYVDHDY